MYIIPRNISKRFEFFPGWGWQELIMLLFGAGTGVLISAMLSFITQNPVRFLPILFFGAVGYLTSKPILADGSTALQIVQYARRFNSSQKLYLAKKGGF